MISKYTLHLDKKTTRSTTLKPPTAINPHREIIDGVHVLWAATSTSSPFGILFVAHGCSHSHTDWFSNCGEEKQCLGLPEEMAIVHMALERNLIVVAASSLNRKSKCWDMTQDGPRIATVLDRISKRLSPDKENGILPIFAFGASEGGAFVSGLARYVKLAGFLSQISAKPNPEPVDCMVYLTMKKDSRSDLAAIENLATAKNGKRIHLPALQISSPSFFSERIPNMPLTTSTSIVNSLVREGYVDDTGLLLQDPRQSDWRRVVRDFSDSTSLIADESPLSEVMNVAFGFPEITREGVEDGLDFCLRLQARKS